MPRKPSKTSWGGRGGRSGNFDDKHYFGIFFARNLNVNSYYKFV